MTRMFIYLGLLLPTASSDLPGNRSGKPIISYLVLLRMGFTCALLVTSEAVVSYTAFPPLPDTIGRFISVALALESPPPDVIRHPALRSPDFPQSGSLRTATIRSAYPNEYSHLLLFCQLTCPIYDLQRLQPCYSTRPIEGVYCSLRKSHSKSLRDGIFAVKLGFFAKKPRKTPRVSSRSVL